MSKLRLGMVIPLAMLSLLFATVAFITSDRISRYRADVLEYSRTMLSSSMSQLQNTLTSVQPESNPRTASESISYAALLPGIGEVLLADEHDMTFISNHNEAEGKPASSIPGFDPAAAKDARTKQCARIVADQDKMALYAYYPLTLGIKNGGLRPNRIGIIFATYDMSPLYTEAKKSAASDALKLCAIFALLSLSTATALHLLVARRVLSLSAAVSRISAGDLDARAPVSGRDEIALLARNFNSLADRLIQTQNTLAESELQFHTLLDSASEGIILVSTSSKTIRYANPALSSMFGYTADELIGMDIAVLHPPDAMPRVAAEFEEHARGMNPVSLALPCLRKNGSVFPADIQSSPAEIGGETFLVGFFRDATSRIYAAEARRKILEHEKLAAVGKVAGKVAHDFNNLLGIILGTSDLLLSEDLPPGVAEDVAIIRDTVRKGREITKNLSFFAKDQDPKPSRFDLNETIARLLKGMKTELAGIDTATGFESEREPVIADPSLLENAIVNLIQNSIHALAKTAHPKLLITTRKTAAGVSFTVSDNGCGIPPEFHDKIYEPTFTLKGSEDKAGAYPRSVKGSGYGLSNVKRFVDKHAGDISFTSAPGQGTAFTVTLPQISGRLDTPDIASTAPPTAVPPKRVLVVEDETHLANILLAALSKAGHSADLAIDGESALRLSSQNSYDIVSLDYLLPDLDGVEIYRRLRTSGVTAPIIFVSGNFEFMQSMIAIRESDPHVGHLPKPFDNQEYLAALYRWFA